MNRAVSHHFLSVSFLFQIILLFYITFTNSSFIQIIISLILSIFYTVFICPTVFVYYKQFKVFLCIYCTIHFSCFPTLFLSIFDFVRAKCKKINSNIFPQCLFFIKKDDGNPSGRFSRTLNSNYKKRSFSK